MDVHLIDKCLVNHLWVPAIKDGADGAVGQIWRLAANILKKQSWKPTKSGPPAWGFGMRLTTSHCINILFRNITQGLGRAHVNAALNLRVP
jgi:hypothetical protein